MKNPKLVLLADSRAFLWPEVIRPSPGRFAWGGRSEGREGDGARPDLGGTRRHGHVGDEPRAVTGF
jgi:hypothetical protein